MGEAKKCPQYIAAMAAAGGAFVAGTLLGWTNPAQTAVMAGELGVPVNDNQFSWIGSCLNLGAAFTCIPIGSVVNLIGRKKTLLTLIVPMIIGWGLLLHIKDLIAMYLGRVLLGISAAGICVTAPLYIGEIGQKEIRGMLGAFFQLMITMGILFVYVVGAIFDVMVMSVICEILPIVFFVVLFLMPESPVYLIKKDDMEGAQKSMQFLRGTAYDASSEINDMKATEAKIKEEHVSFFTAMKRRSSMIAILIGMGLMFFQQLCGINAVIFYSTEIFEVAKTGISPKISTNIIGVVQVLATLVATLTVDRVGRRILLLISGFMMAVSTTCLGVYFFLQARNADSVKSIGWLPLISLCLFIIMFSVGYGPVPWLLLGELFASDIKGVAASLAATVNWGLAFLVTKAYTNVKEALGTGETFFIFSVLSLLGVVFVFFVVPETKGKSLNEIQQILAGEQS